MSRIKWNSAILLYGAGILPVISYWVYFVLIRPGPFFQYYDPEVVYFIDSLAIYGGHSYAYFDHPGTPVTMIGSFLFGLTYPFIHKTDFILYHLTHPQTFFLLAYVFLLTLFVYTVFRLLRTAKSLLSAGGWIAWLAIPMVFFAVHPNAFRTIALWSHNAFSFPLGALLLIALFDRLRDGGDQIDRRWILGFGCLNGLFATVQVYFAVWIVTLIFVLFIYCRATGISIGDTAKTGLHAALGGLLGVLLGLLPIVSHLPKLFAWIVSIITHQGVYGSGASGVYSIRMITANLRSLYAQTPALMIFTTAVIMISLTILIRGAWWKEHPGQFAVLAGLTVQSLLLFAVVLKQPGGLYLLSVAATLPVMIIIIFQYLSQQGRAIVMLTQVISVGIILVALWNLRPAINGHGTEVTGLGADQYQIDGYISNYAKNSGVGERDVVVLYSYGIYDRCYSLLFGDNYVGSPLSQELSRICPMRFEVNIWNQRILNGNGFVPLDSMKWDLLFTREYLLTEFPFLQAMGLPEQIRTSESFLPYGHLEVIKRVQ